MKTHKSIQRDKNEWVFIVVHSGTLHYQIYEGRTAHIQPRHPTRWIRMLSRLFVVGKQIARFI